MTPKNKNQLNNIKPGFYTIDGKLHKIEENGDMFEVDFDNINKGVLRAEEDGQPPTKKNIECDSVMKKKKALSKDITPAQVEENYYVETSKTEIDGSHAMYEKRVSAMMEANPKISREEALKMVRKKMKAKDKKVEIINTEDTEEEVVEDVNNEEKKTEEVCPKELDMLREKAKAFDLLQEEHNSLKEDMKPFVDYVEKLKAKEAQNIKEEIDKKVSKVAKDFTIPEEKLREKIGKKTGVKALKKITDFEDILASALKANSEGVEEDENTEDMTELLNVIDTKAKELDQRYNLKM